MISIRHLSSAVHAALLLAAWCLASASAMADASSGPTLGFFMKSRVEKILEKSLNPADARKALQEQFRTIKSQEGSLTPLCNYLRSREDIALAKPLLAMSLAANEQYQAAAEVLAELAKNPQADPWVTAELARVSQLIDVQRTWNLLGGDEPATLSPDEKKRIEFPLQVSIDPSGC